MISLREIQKLLVHKAFNPYIDIKNSDKVLIHLVEEIGEICKAHRLINLDKKKLKEELGDTVILLCFYAESVKIDLEHETLMKIKDNIEKGKFEPNKKFLKSLGDLFE